MCPLAQLRWFPLPRLIAGGALRHFLGGIHEAFPATAGGPAALGLMASGANAAELNINGVSEYACRIR